MLPFHAVLVGSLLILGWGACAKEVEKQIYPEPQVHLNLTFDEYLAKVAEHAKLGANGNPIEKRAVGRENDNNVLTQDMIEALSGICVGKYGSGFRASSGFCVDKHRNIRCGHQQDERRRNFRVSRMCPEGEQCLTFEGTNFIGNKVTFPFCGPRIEVNQRHDQGIHTEYDGVWFPESPKSPGTYNDFAALEGSLHGYYDWTGTYNNGYSFTTHSFGHTWSCIGCPAGKLSITHTNVPAYAVGYTSVQKVWLGTT